MLQVHSFLLASNGPFFGVLPPMLSYMAGGMFEVGTDSVILAIFNHS